MKHIKWDYYYFDNEHTVLCRIGLKEKEHLMWQFGGIPMFNSDIYNKNNSIWLGVKTDKRKFVISRKLFEDNKKIWNNNGEKQYYCDLFFWDVKELPKEKPVEKSKK